MSSRPGLFLEDYLAWAYNIVVEGQSEANFSLGLAEALGSIPARQRATPWQFRQIVEIHEPWRTYVEDKLSDFEEDEMSWRDYAGYAFCNLPASVENLTLALLGRQTVIDLSICIQAAWHDSLIALAEESHHMDFIHARYGGKDHLATRERLLTPHRKRCHAIGTMRYALVKLNQPFATKLPS